MVNLEIKKSHIAGDGVFTKDDVISGENIGLGYERISTIGNPDVDFMRTSLGEKINHSQDPNVELLQDGDKFYFISLRDIPSGEELFLNYESIPWEGKRDFS